LFNLLQQNGRKSHRYEKKTVFDILDVVYNCTMSDNQAVYFVYKSLKHLRIDFRKKETILLIIDVTRA
ncbi:hypothetical protein P4310_30505, partial [Bacillus thuringiensis]|nr:hypothetical protein [Bacillus thuringiensis]